VSGDWIESQKNHFDRELDDYAVMYGAETPFHEAMTKRLLEVARPLDGERVLDLGCGVGRVTLPLVKAACRVTGLDFSAVTLEVLSRKVSDLGPAGDFEALCIEAERLEASEEFELAVGRGFLHHLRDPAAVLKRVHEALVPGGRAVFMDPNPLQPAWLPLHLFHPTLSMRVERYLWRGFPGWSRQKLVESGFVNVRLAFAGLVPPQLWGRMKSAPDIEGLLTALPGLRRLALYTIVRGEKKGP